MIKKIFITSLLTMLTIIGSSCKPAGVQVHDKKDLGKRLVERVNVFQNSLVEKNFAKAWEMTLSGKKNLNDLESDSYIQSFRDGNHMAQYYNVKYRIDGIEMTGNKAAVKMTFLVKAAEESDVIEAGMYDHWTYEEGDWYFEFGGKTEFYKNKNW